MTDRSSYRVNFTMPRADTELNKKLCELFERHRDIGTLRHWLMALATDAAQRELGDRAATPSVPATPKKTVAKPKKIESFTDLLPESDSEPATHQVKSKELDAYDSLRAEFKKSDCDSSEWDEFFEKHKPAKLNDL